MTPGGDRGRLLGAALGAALGAVLLAATGCGGGEAGDWRSGLVPVPEPSLARREAADRLKLHELRRKVEARVAEPEATAAEVAAAYGELGRAYLAHELMEPAEASLANAAAADPEDFRWPYLLGVIAQRDGRFEEAARRLRRTLKLAPGDPASLVRLGRIDLEGSRHGDARRWFEDALADDGTAAAAHFGLGGLAADEGDFATAVRHFQEALTIQPAASAVQYPLGLALRELGDREGAQEHLAQAGDQAVELDDPLVEGLSELVTGARSYLMRADRARDEGDLDTALRHYRLAVEADPDLALARYGLGTLLGEQGQLEEAVLHLRRAVELDPDFPEAHFNLGTALLRQGHADEALEALDRVLELDPGHVGARLRRAGLRRDRGDGEGARADLETLLKRDPLNTEALEDLAVLLARRGREREAESLLRGTLAQDPPAEVAARIHFTRAFLANERRDLEAAIEAYRQAVKAQGDFAEARFNLAVSLVLARRPAEAARELAEVVRLQPDNARAHLGRAQAWIAAGRWQEARAAFEDGVGRLPQDQALVHGLAELLAASPDPSVRDGERALALALAAYQATRGAEHAEVVAMALAELGRFDEAVRWQRQLLDQAEAVGAPADTRARLAANLRRYERGEAVRLKPAGPG